MMRGETGLESSSIQCHITKNQLSQQSNRKEEKHDDKSNEHWL